ncbi:hypothetical protein HID58_025150 [Brassica napus]|uniref:Uncharacterized protein n=1 Tax=Brassica napus TaxID=3708 RepID=A0ABQ8CKB8_BRANA|nr:hypothetical protein HID58_025150 [Brassica napus]
MEVLSSSSGKEPHVREVPKKQRKRLPAFAGNWTAKFAFMRLPGFSPIWQLEDLPRVEYSSGKETIEQAALKRCSIWGEMLGSKGDEALAEFKKAFEVMSTRKSTPSELPLSRTTWFSFSGAANVWRYFLRLPCWHQKRIPPWPFNNSGDCFRWASPLFHLGERMVGAASTKPEMDCSVSQLRKEMGVVLAKDKEIKAFRLKVRNQEAAGEWAAERTGSNREYIS